MKPEQHITFTLKLNKVSLKEFLKAFRHWKHSGGSNQHLGKQRKHYNGSSWCSDMKSCVNVPCYVLNHVSYQSIVCYIYHADSYVLVVPCCVGELYEGSTFIWKKQFLHFHGASSPIGCESIIIPDWGDHWLDARKGKTTEFNDKIFLIWSHSCWRPLQRSHESNFGKAQNRKWIWGTPLLIQPSHEILLD